jgi:hypothetical protein
LPGTDNLAYLKNSKITDKQVFITLGAELDNLLTWFDRFLREFSFLI